MYSPSVIKKKMPAESALLAERVGGARDLLRKILAEDLHPGKFRTLHAEPQGLRQYRQMREDVLTECHTTFRTCFHAFYPTSHLKWWCLCDLLCQTEPVSTHLTTWLNPVASMRSIGPSTADPPESCHLNVKKLPKTWHLKKKNSKHFHFLQKNCQWQKLF